MDKYKIIIFCGESATGKTFQLNRTLVEYPEALHCVITATTRPMREGEVNGKDYFFLTEEEFNSTEMIETCRFNNWYYGTPVNSLSKNKINLLVMNPNGIMSLSKKTDEYDIKIIRLKVNDKTRLLRQLNREENPNVDEIIRRWKTDKEDFAVFDEKYKEKMFIAESADDLSMILFHYIYCWDNSCPL